MQSKNKKIKSYHKHSNLTQCSFYVSLFFGLEDQTSFTGFSAEGFIKPKSNCCLASRLSGSCGKPMGGSLAAGGI